jgi:hypothetical protein
VYLRKENNEKRDIEKIEVNLKLKKRKRNEANYCTIVYHNK